MPACTKFAPRRDGNERRATTAQLTPRAAEEARVFGVPTYVLDGEIYWGREHLSLIRARLEDAGLRRLGAAAPAAMDYAWRDESAG